MKRVRHLHLIIACRFSWRQTIVTKTSTHNFRIFQFHYLFNLLVLEDKTPSTVFLISMPLFLSPTILLFFWKTKSIYNATVFLKITINYISVPRFKQIKMCHKIQNTERRKEARNNSHKALRLQQHKTKRKNLRSWRQLPASISPALVSQSEYYIQQACHDRCGTLDYRRHRSEKAYSCGARRRVWAQVGPSSRWRVCGYAYIHDLGLRVS
jgi:hypothetical protein